MDNWNNWILNLRSYRETGRVNITGGLTSRENSIDLLLNICKEHTKLFKISKEITKLLLLTKNNFRPKYNLPFESMFLDCNIDYREGEIIRGMQIQHVTSKVKETGELRDEVVIFMFVEKLEGKKILFINFTLNKSDTQLDEAFCHIVNFEKPEIKDMGLFAINFLDFLNNPEVELVKVERTKEQNNKRILRGKRPIPTQVFIRVNGKLKLYLNQLEEGGHFKYNYRFWVRGHFRTLRNEERYKDKVGTKIWILPFIKGRGILINKPYEVSGNSSQT